MGIIVHLARERQTAGQYLSRVHHLVPREPHRSWNYYRRCYYPLEDAAGAKEKDSGRLRKGVYRTGSLLARFIEGGVLMQFCGRAP